MGRPARPRGLRRPGDHDRSGDGTVTDWSPLGWHEDPVPGSPDSVQDGADAMAAVATTISEAAENLRSIASSEGQVSLAVDAFRERALEVAGQIELVHDRYSGAADALSGYVEPLRSAQSLARQALEEATAARTALTTADADVYTAEQGLAHTLPEDMDRANETLSDAYTARAGAQEALDDAVIKLNTAIGNRDAAAESAMSLIDEALEANGLDDNGWRQFLNKNAELLDGIAKGLAIAGAVLAVVAMFIPGVNILVGLGIGLGAAAINFALAENGNKGWQDFAWDVVGLATLGAGKLVGVAMRGRAAARAAQVSSSRSNVLAGPAVPRGRTMPHGRHRPGGQARNRQRRQRIERGRQAQAAEYSQMTYRPDSTVLRPSSLVEAARHNISQNGWNVLRAGGGDAYQMSYYNAMRAPGMGGGQAAASMSHMANVNGTLANAGTVHTIIGADLSGFPRPGADWVGGQLDSLISDQPLQDDVTSRR
ncbi:putative T7SS-secreted protein [Georgenia sp. Marseille-Q6866]